MNSVMIKSEPRIKSLRRKKGSLRIADELREAIRTGKLPPGLPIVSERKLADSYQVSHATARKATQMLVDEGLLEKHPGKGVFVKDRDDLKVKTIGICVPTLTLSIYSEMVELAEQMITEAGHRLFLIRRDEEKDHSVRPQIVEKYLHKTPVDALVFSSQPAPGEIDAIKQFLPDIRVAAVDADLSKQKLNSVYCNNETGAFLATEHLLMQGIDEVLYIGQHGPTFTARARERGYLSAMNKWNRKPYIINTPSFDFNGGIAGVEQAIKQSRGGIPKAIFAVTDLVALGAIEALRKHGLSVPGDVKIVGFSNLREARYHSPSISSVECHMLDMIKIALRHLFSELTDKHIDSPLNCMLPASLMIRESSQPSWEE